MRLTVRLSMLGVLLSVAACGGGGDDNGADTTTVTITPLLDAVPAGMTEDEALADVAAVMEERAALLEGSATTVVNADGSITVEASDIAEDVARELFGTTALMRMQQPQRDAIGSILCSAPDGSQTAISILKVTYPVTGGTRLPKCDLGNDILGDILWEPATGNAGEELTGNEIDAVGLTTEQGPTLVVHFLMEANQVLFAISTRLVDLPLGIFIDDDLVSGPTVSEPIINGRITIAGLSLRDARILRAQLEAGELPVPVSVSNAAD
ncbi:MAG: hypothetical protein WD904_05130 [Dehalococcoidia bacterium]